MVEDVAGSLPFTGDGGGGDRSNQRSVDLGSVPTDTGASTTPTTDGSSRAGSRAVAATSSGTSRLVEGRLYIDASGRAWIEGVAEDVDDSNDRFATTQRRMGG